jgi:hypothetical protein
MITVDTALTNFLELVAAELGFHPSHSLVAYGLTSTGPNPAFRVPLYDAPVTLEHLHYLSSQLHSRDCTTAVLIAYSDQPGAGHSLDRARFECDASGIDVLAQFAVPGELTRPRLTTTGARS